MNILGISAYFHDAAAALYRDGEIVAAISEDRLTHIKHDANFPLFAIEFCLESAGLRPKDLDGVVFYEEPHVKFGRVLTLLIASFPNSAGAFASGMRSWLTTRLWLKTIIASRLGVDPAIVSFVPHHVSHASQAFFPSGFEEAAVLTMDGVGEWATVSIARASRSDGITLVETTDYPHSLGLAYGAVTGFLGFTPNDQECSTMALAAFGEPRFGEEFRNALMLTDGRLTVDQGCFDFMGDSASAVSRTFARAFGLAARNDTSRYAFDIFADGESTETAADKPYADVAASLQARTDEVVCALADRARKLTGLDQLCFAGGVAYNAVSVGKLVREGPFQSVYVPPDPGDAGGAIGAALYAAHAASPDMIKPAPMPSPYLGASSAFDLGDMLDALDTSKLPPRTVPPQGEFRMEADWRRITDENALLQETADELYAGKVVGWIQGRSEFGPRALGNRSILADPSKPQLARKISLHIKVRDPFRPYALSVAEEDAQTLFDFPDEIPQPARWMQMVVPVRIEARPKVAAALHVDGTTRPQVCSTDDNALFHALLLAYGQRSRLSALLNTSLNLSGLPLCAGAPEALVLFWSSDIDTLVLNDWVIRKRAP